MCSVQSSIYCSILMGVPISDFCENTGYCPDRPFLCLRPSLAYHSPREKSYKILDFWGEMVSLINEISPSPPPANNVSSKFQCMFRVCFGNFRPKVVVGKAPPLIVGTNTNLFQYPKWGAHSQVLGGIIKHPLFYQILP